MLISVNVATMAVQVITLFGLIDRRSKVNRLPKPAAPKQPPVVNAVGRTEFAVAAVPAKVFKTGRFLPESGSLVAALKQAQPTA